MSGFRWSPHNGLARGARAFPKCFNNDRVSSTIATTVKTRLRQQEKKRQYVLKCTRRRNGRATMLIFLFFFLWWTGKNRNVSLELGRFQVTEGLFHPEAWGLDNPGVHTLVHKAIQVGSKSISSNRKWVPTIVGIEKHWAPRRRCVSILESILVYEVRLSDEAIDFISITHSIWLFLFLSKKLELTLHGSRLINLNSKNKLGHPLPLSPLNGCQ